MLNCVEYLTTCVIPAFYQERKKPGISARLDSGYISECLNCEWLKKRKGGIVVPPKVVYDIGVTRPLYFKRLKIAINNL